MKGISSENQRDLILSVGVHIRERPLSPVEVGELLRKSIDSGTTIKELSSEIMLDSTMIARFLRLSNLNPETQHLVGWGGKSKISFSTAAEIARTKTAAEQDFLTRATIENRLSKTEIIHIVETRTRFGRPISDCVDEVVKMRPQITKRYLYIGGVRSAQTRARLAEITQKERDALFQRVIRSVCPELPGCSGQLGKDRFSIVGDEDLDRVLSSIPSGFESVVNTYLELGMRQKNA